MIPTRLPRRRKREPMGVRESDTFRSDGHLKFVRGFECLCASTGECEGKMEAHHNRENGNAGTGLKPSDADAVPLCLRHHALGHSIGWKTFELRYGVDLDKAAAHLADRSPHYHRWLGRNML